MIVNRLEVHQPARWSAVVAAELVDRLTSQGAPRISLPTGRTTSEIYRQVVGLLADGSRTAEHATVVLLDEYLGLPAGDRARCDEQIRHGLINRLDRPPRLVTVQVDRMSPSEAAAELDQAARHLDLAVVGLGLNGHVGMNEPGSTATAPTRVVEIADSTRRTAVQSYGASTGPTGGITIGMARLLDATELWLLVNGSAKAGILATALTGPQTADVPASLLRQHPRLRVIVDTDAARLLDHVR